MSAFFAKKKLEAQASLSQSCPDPPQSSSSNPNAERRRAQSLLAQKRFRSKEYSARWEKWQEKAASVMVEVRVRDEERVGEWMKE
ncbi:MAG: hypothetical protein MMC33_007672 [Icmadophila ericetorum]|nr:hypothetical protein [Icmadophila ericetorum]